MNRSEVMRRVRSKATGPELVVRSLLKELVPSIRLRYSPRALPGKPDIVIGRDAAIQVNGCFWHGHGCRRGRRVPKVNRAYWVAKIARNIERDRAVAKRLRSLGFELFVVWECQTTISRIPLLRRRLRRFVGKL